MLNTTDDEAGDVSAEKPEAIVISNDRDDDVSDHHEDDFKLGKDEVFLDTKVRAQAPRGLTPGGKPARALTP